MSKIQDGSTTIFIEEDAPARSLFRRILHRLSETTLWALACALPIAFIIYGVFGIRDRHIPGWKMRREKFGDDAVSHSLIVISIGLWALGQVCYLKTGRPVLKIFGWILAIGTFALGIWIRLRN